MDYINHLGGETDVEISHRDSSGSGTKYSSMMNMYHYNVDVKFKAMGDEERWENDNGVRDGGHSRK